MSLSEFTKLSIAFKKLIARDHSIIDKEWYEEEPGGGFNVHTDDVWADEVPATPPASSTSVIKVYTDAADGALKLTEDVTVSGARGWMAEDPVGTRIGNFVPAKYNQGYTARIYEDNGSGTAKGSQIFTTDTADWFFDEVSGYLALQDTHSFQTPLWLEAYRYIGESATDKLSGTSSDKTVGLFICDSGLSTGDLVKISATGDTVTLASNSGANIGEAVGVCVDKPTSTSCSIRFIGEAAVFSGLTPGAPYYLGVDGAITDTPVAASSTLHQLVGVAKNSSTLVFERGSGILF